MATIDVPVLYLEELLTNEQLNELITTYAGCRIYIPKKAAEYQKQKQSYCKLLSLGMSHDEAILNLSYQFEIGIQSIKNHFNKGLFDDKD